MDKSIDFDGVADIYDYYVTVDFDLDFFIKEFAAIKGCKVLELMCGTGRVSLPLLHNGVDLTCLDYSQQMLQKLADKINQQRLSAKLIEADVRNFKLPQTFDYIFIPFHSFAEITQPQDRYQALRQIELHLKTNGTFICTLHNPVIRNKIINGQLMFRGEFPYGESRNITLLSVENPCKDGIVNGVQYFEIYDAEGFLQQKRRLPINFSLIYPTEFEEMASRAGLKIIKVYGDYSGAPFDATSSPVMIYFLQKNI